MIDSPAIRIVLAASLALAGACSSNRSPASDDPASGTASAASAEERLEAPMPWTDAFQKAAVLVAAEVRIEGPVGLLRHVATVSDATELQRVEKTLPEGFLQQITAKPDAVEPEIRAQLDRLAIIATRRLVILERPGPVDVLVIATGEAYWACDQEDERRGESLRLEGKIRR
jgi:hypothetical protein